MLAVFHNHAVDPVKLLEVRELQTALGLVVAGSGALPGARFSPAFGRDEIVFRPLAEADAVSPIILSWRSADESSATALLSELCSESTIDA